MKTPALRIARTLGGLLCGLGFVASIHAQTLEETEQEVLELDQNCIINILNRTVSVQDDGTWFLTNVPSNMGQIRARATCTRDGVTERGASDYFNIVNNEFRETPQIYKATKLKVPTKLTYGSPGTAVYTINEDGSLTYNQTNNLVYLSEIGETYQALVNAYYADGSEEDVTQSTSGINYISTNPAIASVTNNGLITAVSPGNVSLVARKDEVITLLQVTVNAGEDLDGDGLPDDYETANGLNPNDPVDAQEDIDGDGLTALEEFNAGTSIHLADTDGDGINDKEEITEGEDGYITNALLADSDGDLLPDLVEITTNTDPNDADDADFAAAILSIRSTPSSVSMTFNSIDSEVSTQLSITATLVDGSTLDVTSSSFGTNYESSDLSVVSFGTIDGEIFGGEMGEAEVTVSLFELEITVEVTVESFQPLGRSTLTFTGNGTDTDVQGDWVYIAAGTGGVHIVDVSDKDNPSIESSYTAASGAIDVKVSGDHLYVARGLKGIDILDVSDKANPTLLANYPSSGSATELAIDNGLLFIANGAGGLEIIDVSEPATPISVSVLDGMSTVLGVDAQGDRAVVVNSSSMIVIDISDPASPLRLGSINIGNLRAVVMNGDYAYVACYTCGYKVINISDPMSPQIVGSDSRFYPTDVELTNGLAFFADTLFVNAVPYVNIFDPENSIYQGVIDIREFGDRDATGLSLDAGFVYSTGYNRLYISQYRMLDDTQGIPPTVSILQPADGAVVVEGSKIQIQIDASDDIAVSVVQLTVNDEFIASDTTLPYEIPFTIPNDITALDIQVSAIDFGNNVGETNVLVSVEPDADGDGLGDTEEAETWLTEPDNPDTDGDTLTDGDEVRRGTNPLSTDSDGDGIEDGVEVENGTDPTNPDVTPPTVSSTDPEEGATEVCENQSITVTFSETMQRKSIVAANIQLLDNTTDALIAASISLQTMDTEAYINPVDLLADNTEYRVAISNVRDSAGNLLESAFESLFTTGNCVDEERPYIVDSSPVNGADDISVNARITILLNEPVEPDTVTEDSFYVYDADSGERINGFIELAENNSALIFTPNTPLLVGRRHYATLTSDILDQFGNAMYNTSRYFNTSFEPDGDGPVIVATTVNHEQTAVPMNVKLAVKFDEQINALYLNDIQLLNSDGEEVPVTRSLSTDRSRVILSPTATLDANSDYTFVIDGVQDLSGNLLPSSQNIAFTTSDVSDTEAGYVESWSLPNYGTDLPLNAVLQVDFSEAIDPTSINSSTFYLYDDDVDQKVKGQYELANDGYSLKFIPEELLREDHRYIFYVGYSPFLTDFSGNIVGRNKYNVFYTGIETDDISPLRESFSIADGMTDVPVNAQIEITFDSDLNPSCLLNSTVTLTDGTTQVEVSLSLPENNTVRITTGGLAASTTYQFELNGVCDYAGNIIDSQLISFTTSDSEDNDTTAPGLVSITPANNSTDISITSDIVMVFDEPISATSRPPVIGADITVPGEYTIEGNTITFTPDIPLAGSTIYDVSLNYSVKDLAGHSRYLGYRRFTTQDVLDDTQPGVVAISPANGASDVHPYQSVVITFDEPLNVSTLNSNNIAIFSGGEELSTSIYRSADGRQVTISGSFPSSSLLSVVMTADVTDLSGNRIQPFISSYTTGVSNHEVLRPEIIKQVPAYGSSGWTNLSEVYFYTNEPLDPSTFEDAFKLAENGVLIDVEIETIGDGRTIKVSRDGEFAEGALIQLYWTADATDYFGNPLYESQTYFTTGFTEDLEGTRPYVTAYAPGYYTGKVPLNPLLRVQFSEPMDEDSFSSDTIALQNPSDGWTDLAITTSLDESGTILLITPDELLAPDSSYYIRIDAAVMDTDGDNLSYSTGSYFYTAEEAVEDDRAPVLVKFSPPEGISGVGTLPQFALRVDETVNNLSFSHPNTYNVMFSEDNTEIRYEYLTPLSPDQLHTESTPAISDMAGNSLLAAESSFTTAGGPDLTRPNLIDISIEDNDTDIPVNASIILTFDEPIDELSLDSDYVFLRDEETYELVSTTMEFSRDGTRLTFTPAEALLSGRRYLIYQYYVTDLSGNSLSNIYRRFTTSFEEDHVAPVITDASVSEGDTDVPLNVRLNVRFDEPLAPINVDGITLLDDSSEEVPFTWTLTRNRSMLTIIPSILLSPLSTYTLMVEDQADVSDNALEESLNVSFTTADSADLVEGSAVSWSIHRNNLQVPTNVQLRVTFSEPVDSTTVDDESFYLEDTSVGTRVPSTWHISEDGLTLTLIPNEPLRADHRFYWYTGYYQMITDFAGNRAARDYRYFTTLVNADDTQPDVEAVSIADGSVDIPINGRVVIRFDEPISDGCPLGDAFTVSDGVSDISVTATLQSDRRTVNIIPSENWDASTTYTFTASGVCDYSGNLLSAQEVTFTTSSDTAPDNTNPYLTEMSPAHNAVDVSVDLDSIVLTFDETVNPLYLPTVTANGLTVPGTVTVEGNVITFTPASTLRGSTLYTVNIGSIHDLAGNNGYWGSRRFTTEATGEDNTAPGVVAISPAANSTDVDPTSTVVVTFDEPLNSSEINSNNIAFYANGEIIRPSITRSGDGTEITVSAGLPADSLISLVITDAITDLSGNQLPPFLSSFTTGPQPDETGRPSVTAQYPYNGSSDWYNLDTAVVIFTEAMDESSFEEGLNVTENGHSIDVDYYLSGDGRTLTITKPEGFNEGAYVAVLINGSATDITGNAVYDYSGYFRTGSTDEEVGSRPSVTAYFPSYYTPGVPLNAKFVATFSESMDSDSLSEGSVILYNADDGFTEVASNAEFSSDGKLIVVTPEELLEADTRYYVSLNSTLLDTDGDALYSASTYFFTESDAVEDDSAPTILAFSPPDGQLDVGTNTRLSIHFDEYMNPLTFNDDNGSRVNIQFNDDYKRVTYSRRYPFGPEQEVVEAESSVTDIAGNAVQAGETTFTTANGPDLQAPQLLDFSVTDIEGTVPTNAVVRWVFDEPIDPVSILTDDVYIYDTTAGEIVPSTYELSSDGKQLTLIPTEAFTAGSRIYGYLRYLRDLSGNTIYSSYNYFTVGEIPDLIAPTVINATVSEGTTGVPVNARLNVRFSESLNPISTASIELKDSSDNIIPINISVSREKTMITVVSKALLVPLTDYTLTISGVSDLSDNELASDFSVTFTTGTGADLLTGSLSAFSIPYNNIRDYPLNPQLIVTFNERIDRASIDEDTFHLLDNTSGSIVPSTWTLSGDGRTLTLLPSELLATDSVFYLRVSYSPYLKDYAGNNISGGYRYFYTGTEEDTEAPIVLRTSITNGQTDLPVNSQIELVMSEQMGGDGCPITEKVKLLTGDSAIETAVSLSDDRQTIIVKGENNLSPNTTYTVSVDGICDYAGNTFTNTNLLSFTTADSETTDTTAPQLVEISPASGETGVAVSTVITLVFDEPVALTSRPTLTDGSNEISGTYAYSGSTITFTPDEELASGANYYVNMSYKIADFAGNRRYSYNINFSTE